MRIFLLVVAIFIAVAVGVSAVAWPLYTLLLLERWMEFDKFVKWLVLLVVAITTVALLRPHGVSWSVITGTTKKSPGHSLVAGLVIGFLTLASLGVVLYLLDIRVAAADASLPDSLLKLVVSVLPAALAISLLEETYFRGVQCGVLMRENRVLAAITLPSTFYAAVHFLNPPTADAVAPEWFYGLSLLLSAPVEICRASDCLAAAATLLLAGVLLALVRLLGGHLALCIGIHAGWICGIKLTKQLTNFDSSSKLAFLADGQDHFIGILAALWLAIPCVWLINRLIKNS